MDDLLHSAQVARKSGVALKTELAIIKSGSWAERVFVFEGKDDVGPYEAWINRIDENLRYIPLPGTGKRQVLELRELLIDDETGIKNGTFFFVDRDFDGLRGQDSGTDIFCTDTYSIENLLVSQQILRSILLDEFQLSALAEIVDRIQTHFRNLLSEFSEIMSEPNWRIYYGVGTSNRKNGVTEKVSRYVEIDWDSLSVVYNETTLPELIPLADEPRKDSSHFDEFRSLTPLIHHRGKYYLSFFFEWLQSLSDALKEGKTTFLSHSHNTKFNRGTLTLRNLASRSELPLGLTQFIEST